MHHELENGFALDLATTTSFAGPRPATQTWVWFAVCRSWYRADTPHGRPAARAACMGGFQRPRITTRMRAAARGLRSPARELSFARSIPIPNVYILVTPRRVSWTLLVSYAASFARRGASLSCLSSRVHLRRTAASVRSLRVPLSQCKRYHLPPYTTRRAEQDAHTLLLRHLHPHRRDEPTRAA